MPSGSSALPPTRVCSARTLTLNGRPVQVIGVLPRGMQVMDLEADVWRPLRFTAADETSLNRYLWVVGRIRPGASVAQASAEVEAIARAQSSGLLGARAVSLQEQTVGSLEQDLPVLLGATGVLLLIACANVASLTLARGASRRREFMVRAALGAGRARIARQLLTEGTLLALLGGAAGLLLAAWLARGFQAWLPQAQTLPDVNLVDARVFAFALGVSLVTAVLFGIAPALQAASKGAMTGLRAGTRSVTAGLFPLRVLAGIEVALAVALLISAGLVARSFVRLTRIDLGFRPAGVTTFDLPRPNPDPERAGSPFHDELLRRLLEAPGVEAAAVSQALPLKSFCCGSNFPVEGEPPRGTNQLANWRSVSPEYFQTIGLPLREGRPFDARDQSTSERVAIVSASYASRAFPAGTSPIGRHIGWATLDHPMTVIGVANDIRLSPASEPNPHVYMPYTQVAGFLPSQLAVRTSLPKRAGDRPCAAHGVGHRPAAARRQYPDDGGVDMEADGPTPLPAGDLGGLRARGREPGPGRRVRRGVLFGAPDNEGARYPARAGGSPSALGWLVLRQGAGVAAGGIGGRTPRRLLDRRPPQGVPGHDRAPRSVDVRLVALLAGLATLAACALPARRAGRVDPLTSVRLE